MLLYSNKHINIRFSLATLICPLRLVVRDLRTNGCAFSKTKRLIISVAVPAVEEGQLIFALRNGDLLFLLLPEAQVLEANVSREASFRSARRCISNIITAQARKIYSPGTA